MRTHPGNRKSVSIVGGYYLGQDARAEPGYYLSLEDAKRERDAGLGQFINRGRSFRSNIRTGPSDCKTYRSSNRKGESLDINFAMMNRFAEGERYAVAAVNGWKTR